MIRGQHNQGTKKVVVPIGSTALLYYQAHKPFDLRLTEPAPVSLITLLHRPLSRGYFFALPALAQFWYPHIYTKTRQSLYETP